MPVGNFSRSLRENCYARFRSGTMWSCLRTSKSPPPAFYYLRALAQLGWSRNVLLNQIKARAYERSLKPGKAHNFAVALPEQLAEQAEEAAENLLQPRISRRRQRLDEVFLLAPGKERTEVCAASTLTEIKEMLKGGFSLP
jgi:hypothetical protein